MLTNIFDVYVEGLPTQQGSMTGYPVRRKNGSIGVSMVHAHSKHLTDWREAIGSAFRNKYEEVENSEGGVFPQYTPVYLRVVFYLPRPKSNKLGLPTSKKADLDKLVRAVNDALTGVMFYDDCQVVSIGADKRWADEEHPVGAAISVQKEIW